MGITSILHTWGQTMKFHPHIHSIVTGGGLKNNKWVQTEKEYLFKGQVLGSLYRGKFLSMLKSNHNNLVFPNDMDELYDFKNFNKWLEPLYQKTWITYIEPPKGSPENVIEYIGRYATKKEEDDAEFEFKLKLREYENTNNVTFEEMIRMFIDFRKDKVKENTLYGYKNKLPYLKSLYKVKLKDFNYPTFERWNDEINSTHLATRTKNDIYKLLKTILNYATAWHEFNFAKVYPKMYNFNDPN